MIITGITQEQFAIAVARAAENYGGNLRPEFGTSYSATRFRARVVLAQTGNQMGLPAPELAPGQRRSGNVLAGERRVNAVCWHAYRDALMEVFEINENTKVRTALAKYLGSDSFYDEYPATGHVNIGSVAYPVTMPETCDC